MKRMKGNQKDSSEKLFRDQVMANSPSPVGTPMSSSATQARTSLSKLFVWLIVFLTFTYAIYTLKYCSSPRLCSNKDPFNQLADLHCTSESFISNIYLSNSSSNEVVTTSPKEEEEKTRLERIVFGIATSASLWEKRKNYIKLWWNPEEMRGIVWLNKPINTRYSDALQPIKISGDTSRFAYKNKQGHRSAIRISRIISETFRLELENVRLLVQAERKGCKEKELRKNEEGQVWVVGYNGKKKLVFTCPCRGINGFVKNTNARLN